MAKPPCVCGGNRKHLSSKSRRIAVAGSVDAIRNQLLQEPSNTPNKKKTKGGRYVNGAPPPATRDSALRIVGLGMVPLSLELQHKLTDFLDAYSPERIESSPSAESMVNSPFLRCLTLENKGVQNDFAVMLSYIEVAFYIQWYALLSCLYSV
jgi:hypothetical protein